MTRNFDYGCYKTIDRCLRRRYYSSDIPFFSRIPLPSYDSEKGSDFLHVVLGLASGDDICGPNMSFPTDQKSVVCLTASASKFFVILSLAVLNIDPRCLLLCQNGSVESWSLTWVISRCFLVSGCQSMY